MLKKLGLVFLLVLSGCTQQKDTLFEKKDLDFMVISDIHYLADELNDDGKAIMELMEEADGRNTPHIVDLFDKWIETVISEKPDMVFITGDISFNGEKKSHEEIADKLMQLKKNNIEVFVLPGNHDIARYAYGFNGEEVYETAVTMEEDYRKIYEDFGYSKAMSIDPASLSYTLNLNEDYVAFMIDGRKSALPEESLEWLEKQVKTAKKAKSEDSGIFTL